MQSKQQHYRELFTESSLSNLQNHDKDQIDKNIYRAIKDNNLSYLIGRDSQLQKINNPISSSEEQILNQLIGLRKKYDVVKKQSCQVQQKIKHLQIQKEILLNQVIQFENSLSQTKTNYQKIQSQQQSSSTQYAYADYNYATKLHIEERLKKDVLYYKKRCFDGNIRLVRLKTQLKQLNQRNINKKNLNSKCRIVLQSLQSTVKMRQRERSVHLQEVKSIMLIKKQNDDQRQYRQRQLQDILYRAQIQKMPEQKKIYNRLLIQILYKKLLKNKMQKLIQKYKQIQQSFIKIKKQTRIKTSQQLIQNYLNKQYIYKEISQLIKNKEILIQKIKQQKNQYQKQNIILSNQSIEINQLLYNINKNQQNIKLQQQKKYINISINKKQKIIILLQKWAHKLYHQIESENINTIRQERLSIQPHQLKIIIEKCLTIIKNKLQESLNSPLEQTTNKQYELSTINSSQKRHIRHTTFDEISSKRMKFQTQSSQNEDNDGAFDEISEYNYLRHNRRLIKKNLNNIRSRVKTRMN